MFKRYFLSDAANQVRLAGGTGAGKLGLCLFDCGTAPAEREQKYALWVYLQSGVQCRALESGLFEVSHGAYRHLWGGFGF